MGIALSWILIFLIVAELALRTIGYHYVPLKLVMLGKHSDRVTEDWRIKHSYQDRYVTFDPLLIWRPNRNYRLFNAQGFKGPILEGKKSRGDFYIFTLGDSNTINPMKGPGWPDYLAELLMGRNPNVKVINAGVWGYSSYQGLLRLKEILHFHPDMVLISFGSNDAHPVTVSDKEYLSYKECFGLLNRQIRLVQFLSFLQDRWIFQNNKQKVLTQRVSLKEYQKNLENMVAIAKKNSIQVILLTRPYLKNMPLPDKTCWRNFGQQYNDVVREVAVEQNVLCIDVFSSFDDQAQFFLPDNDCHFNDDGRKLAAQNIYERIKEFVPKSEEIK